LLSFVAESFVFQFTFQKLKIKIYKTIILPVVLYGCETWSLIPRKVGRTLRLFENRVFGPKGDEETRKWRKLHNEDLKDLYSSLNIFV